MTWSPFRHLGAVVWKSRPLHLTIFLTRRCNARCAFCFSRAIPAHDAPELAADEIERIARTAGRLLWLALSGGEIFLRDDLPLIVASAARHTRPAIILLPTNGLLPDRVLAMTEEILLSCPKSAVVVKVSLDGPPGLHDRLRGVPGAFDRAVETQRRLARLAERFSRLEVGINTVCCGENEDALEETSAIVRGLDGVRTHTISLVRGEAGAALGTVDSARYLEAAERLADGLRRGEQPVYRFRGARLKAAQDVLQRRAIHRTLAERRQVVPCHAGRLNLVLSATGDLYPCENFSLKLGNVREHGCDLGATARTAQGRAVLASIRRGECWCTHECYMMTNILFSPRCYPALVAEYCRLRIGRSR
jgi:radical SAM protein with 4Fe4S-binding SPASM domain